MVYKVSFHLSPEKKHLIFDELTRRLGELKGGVILPEKTL